MKARNPFQFKQFTVHQSRAAMPVTTDACIFGALINANHAKTALDIGTGTGLVSLMLAQRFSELMIGAVEIDKPSAEEASENFKNSPWADRLRVFHADFCHWENHQTYDLIVSNPPFFSEQLPSTEQRKRQARHTTTLNYPILLQKSAALLNPTGFIWLLIPELHRAEIETMAEEQGLFVHKRIAVHASPTHAAHASILCLGFKPGQAETMEFVTYEMPGKYSRQMQEMMGEFYL
jgi:tRNA1Val (adenine37-N6)-methyltransferase